jgi:hypothetical protein
MSKAPSREDEVLLRMLKTPPKPLADVKAKPKVSRPPATKAEQAKYKRSNKTAYKPAPR